MKKYTSKNKSFPFSCINFKKIGYLCKVFSQGIDKMKCRKEIKLWFNSQFIFTFFQNKCIESYSGVIAT